MKCLLTIGFLCINILYMNAQHTLYSNIFDEFQKPIPAVTVRLLSSDSVFIKGEVSNEKGEFQFNNVKVGQYILAFNSIGYENLFLNLDMPNSDYKLPSVVLKRDSIILDAVTVTGSSMIRKKDHLLVIPDKKQIKHAFSGFDLLYNLMIPGLTVNKKNKTVTAVTGDAVFYINGVKADIREIQNLQPKDIEQVEYYILPTKKPYTGDPASINYITKVRKTGGYITLDGEQNIGYFKGDYNINTKVVSNNTTYSIWGGHTMQSYDGIQTEKQEQMLFPSNTINRKTSNNGSDYCNNQQYAQFKVANDNQKRILTATASIIRDMTPHDNQAELLIYNEGNALSSIDESDSKNIRSTLKLDGRFNLNKKSQLNVWINGGYSKNEYKRSYIEEELHSFTETNEDLYSFDGGIAHQYDPNESNSFYSRIHHFHNISSSHYNGDFNSWQHLWTAETMFQFMYIHNFGEKTKLMISPIVTWLNYKLHGYDLSSSWNMRMNTWIVHNINSKQMIGCGYNLGTTQPNIGYLNSVSQSIDFYRIKRGNPYLDNTKMHVWYALYEASLHRLFHLQCVLWYTKDVNNIYTNYYVDGNKLIESYASDDSYNTVKADVSISSRISDNLRVNATYNYKYMYVPNKSNLKEHSHKASFDVNYFINSFTINAYAKTTEKILDEPTLAFIKIPATYGLSIRYSGKNWMAEVGTENPFTKHQHYREYADYGVYRYNQVQTSRIYQQTAYIKLAYTFDFGKKTSRESNSVDRSINSAILKAR